ncbi:hypothetical protein ODW20_21395, partial [Escherichia coli]|nr:hypothetical protein [Escherichia coli]
GTADRNRSHWSTSKTPSYTKSVSWQHHPQFDAVPTDVFCHIANNRKACYDINFRFRRESKK